MAEYWDIYDENCVPTGGIHRRGEPMKKGEFHLVVEIWTINSNREILLTQRHPKKTFPYLWECTGGCVTTGDDVLSAAVRELYEETGIVAQQNELTFIERIVGSRNAIHHHFLLYRDIALEDLKLQADEVIDAIWANFETFCKMEEEKKLFPDLYPFLLKHKERILYNREGI